MTRAYKLFLIAMAIVPASVSIFAADEFIATAHYFGDVSVGLQGIALLQSYSNPGAAPGAAHSQFVINRNDNLNPITTIDLSLNGIAQPILTAITGSTSVQSVNIPSTTGITAQAIIDAGLSTQEVVTTATIDATHFYAIVRKNHTTSGTVRMIYSAYSKFFVSTFNVPGGWIWANATNFGFIRAGDLPPNVYDQYQLLSAGGSGPNSCHYAEDLINPWTSNNTVVLDRVPQYSTGSLSGTGNPTNALTLSAGPITATSAVTPCVQIQMIFTVVPEPTSIPYYQFWWDRN